MRRARWPKWRDISRSREKWFWSWWEHWTDLLIPIKEDHLITQRRTAWKLINVLARHLNMEVFAEADEHLYATISVKNSSAQTQEFEGQAREATPTKAKWICDPSYCSTVWRRAATLWHSEGHSSEFCL